VAVAHILGIEDEKIKEAIAAFKGVKRRFEYVVEPAQGKLVFIDDYAHHPEELKALIQGARSLFEKSKLVLVFQPHLFSRTRDLAAAFASSLGLADEVVLLPIYPARELPVEGVTSYLIAEQIQGVPVHVMEKEELLTWSGSLDVTAQPVVFITAGAGDIDLLLPELKKKLTHA
jgi:UDP-N-acetylmuramate--alanine ligase